MRKGTYRIIIKGTEKGIAVKCMGNTSKLDVMSGMAQAFMGTAKNLGFPIEDLIKCLENEVKDEAPKKRKTTRKSAKKAQEKTAAKKTRKAKGETKNA